MVPYLLVQREVLLEHETGEFVAVDKWTTSGGGVQDEPFRFDETDDLDIIRAVVPESEFRATAVREAFEETNGVVRLEAGDLVETHYFEIPNRVKYPGEYCIGRAYVGVLGDSDYDAVLAAIADRSIDGHAEKRGVVINNHALVPLSTMITREFPKELTAAGFNTKSERDKWATFISRYGAATMEDFAALVKFASAPPDAQADIAVSSPHRWVREAFARRMGVREAAGGDNLSPTLPTSNAGAAAPKTSPDATPADASAAEGK